MADIEEKIPTMSEDDRVFFLENRRWTNRRRMAWVCLCSMVALAGGVVFFGKPIIEPAFYSFASLVGAYMGFSTWAERE